MTRDVGGTASFDGGDWPKLVVDVLRIERDLGRDFEDAWFVACVKYPPSQYGFGRAVRRGDAVESPIAFFKRHARAAYYNVEAERYCVRDCTRLAMREYSLCEVCFDGDEAEAAA